MNENYCKPARNKDFALNSYKSICFLLVFVFSLFSDFASAQGTTCTNATVLTINGTCGSGNITDNSQDLPFVSGCSAGTFRREGWYIFTVSGGPLDVTISGTTVTNGTNLFLQLISSTSSCTGLSQINCANTVGNGPQTETINTTLSNGIYYVKVVNVGGNSNMQLSSICVTATPTVSSFTPSLVCSNSTPVVITGTNFSGVTGVTFGGTNAASYVVDSSTQITAIPVAGSTGVIAITTSGGTATSASVLTVNTTPIVTSSASPTSITNGGTTTLTASATPVTEAVVLLREGFNAPINSWTKINNSTGGTPANAAWTLRPNSYTYTYPGFSSNIFNSNDNSQFYLSNSAAQGTGTTETILQSPVMNSVGYTSLSLEFYQFNLDFDNTDFSRVEVSTNNTTWTTLTTTTTTQGAMNNFLRTTVNLGAYINQPTLYIRFRYSAQFDWFWAIDNVTVSGNKTIPYTYSWSASPSGLAGLPAGAGTASSTNNSIVANPSANTAYTVTATNPNGGCTGISVVNVSVCPFYSLTSVTAVSTACTTNKTSLVTLSDTAASLPIGSYTVTYSLSINSNAISYTAPMTVTTAGTGQFTADLGIMLANTATSIRIDRLASGSCSTNLSSGNISNLINILPPITLTLGAITQPTCAVPTGSVVLNGLPSTGSWTITPFPGTPGITVTQSGATATISGLAQGTSYTFTVAGGPCSPVVSASVPITSLTTTTFDGTLWSSGTGIDKIGTITAGNASPISLTTDTELCSCTISANTNLEVKPGVTLKLENQLIVNASGSITFENGSSLVQVNDAAVNSGVINYKRQTTVVRRASDYTYWSSPVAAQNLLALSPNTNPARFWSFIPGSTWYVEPSPSATTMDIGKGYIIRAPETNYPAYPALSSVFEATFTGVPNNGEKTIAVGGPNTFNLIGNPYPSAIDAVKFLNVNSSVLGGTIYFWTHNTAIRNKVVGAENEGSGDLVFIQDDYASFNRTGGVGTAPAISEPAPKRIPNGMIAAGQSFFTTSTATAGTLVTFNNDMRIGASYLNNSQFFRTKASEKNNVATDRSRIWLNLTNKQNAFKQTLVGYIDGATNDFDTAFDGLSFNANAIINFYSVNNAANYVIQGRALPFEQNDLVPLGYSSTVEGEFAISIDNLDGLFTTQNVFLEDKNTNTIHNLKTSPYSFQTTIGTFNDRFVLRYTDKTLGVEDVIADGNKVFVTVKNKQLKVTAGKEDIKSVTIYSILGKQIYFKKDITSKELVIDNLPSSDQVLIVKTVLEDGTLHTTKTIFK